MAFVLSSWRLAGALVGALAMALAGGTAHAALDIGDPAPAFTAQAALGGQVFRYSLKDELAKGPVVLYFFPAADSADCSIEAHAFAEAIDQFKALGASVIGVSADDIGTLAKFSVKSCQSRFPVASDEGKGVIMISSELPEILGMSDRVVVMSEGRITAELDRVDATAELVMHAASGAGAVAEGDAR